MNNGYIRREKGVVLVMLAVGMLAIAGMTGMAIDLGHGYLNKTRLQYALDAAALSAARTLHQTDKDTGRADAAANATFGAHLIGEMANDPMTLEIEYSNTLNPFTVGGANPNYVRVRVLDFDMGMSFSSLLPGVGDTTTIAASAVAGWLPLGGGAEVCDIAPLVICGDPSDGPDENGNFEGDTIYGIPFDDGDNDVEKICLKASDSTGGNGNSGGGNYNLPNDCEAPIDDIGPGNFQLLDLDCPETGGGACVRESLAGSHTSCLTNSDTVTTKPGNTVGPTAQGFNTRFGEYHGGGVNISDYPPDRVVTEGISYTQYLDRLADGPYDYDDTVGIAERRILAVPIADCGTATQSGGKLDMSVLQFGCFFMTDKTDGTGQTNWIKGTLVRQCQATGKPGTGPVVGGGSSSSIYRIILYKNSDSVES